MPTGPGRSKIKPHPISYFHDCPQCKELKTIIIKCFVPKISGCKIMMFKCKKCGYIPRDIVEFYQPK